MRRFHLLAASIFVTIIFSNTVVAQQPEQVDIRSLNITYQGVEPFFTMVANNSVGQDVTYSGYGTFNLQDLYTCKPCKIPNAFGSNGYQIFGVPGSQFTTFQLGSDTYAYLWITSVDAGSIIVPPRYSWKPRRLLVSVPNKIRGRVEIRTMTGSVLAFANDLNLQGISTSEFSLNNNYPTGRMIWFNQLDIRLTKALSLSAKHVESR